MKTRFFRYSLLLMVLVGSNMLASADSFTTLSVTQNGKETYYQLSDIKKLTFDAENMFMTLTDNEVVTLPFTTLSTVSFGNTTGIASLNGCIEGLTLRDGLLSVNMQNDGKVIIYDTAGKVIEQVSVTKGQNKIDLSRMSKGVYIVRVNGTTTKMLNK